MTPSMLTWVWRSPHPLPLRWKLWDVAQKVGLKWLGIRGLKCMSRLPEPDFLAPLSISLWESSPWSLCVFNSQLLKITLSSVVTFFLCKLFSHIQSFTFPFFFFPLRWEGQRGKEWENLKQAPHPVQSPMQGFDLTTLRSGPNQESEPKSSWMFDRLSQPGALWPFIFPNLWYWKDFK